MLFTAVYITLCIRGLHIYVLYYTHNRVKKLSVLTYKKYVHARLQMLRSIRLRGMRSKIVPWVE